jgi:putative protease
MSEKKLGVVTHYFNHLGVGIVKTSSPLKVGDKVHVKGHTTDFKQSINEMQLNHKSIDEAKKGQEVGIKIKEHVREGDELYAAD